MATSPVDYNRLHCAINASRRILMDPRRQRLEIVREAAGHRWGNAGAAQKTQVNLLGLYQNVVAPLLVSKEPRYYVTTSDQEARPGIRIEQDWLNEQCIHIGLADTARTVVTDALYSTGIMKISLASPCDSAMMAWGITAGEPIVQAIDLDDWVYDPVKDFRYASFVGHRYRCPVEVAKKLYKRANVEFDESGLDEQYNREGDERIDRVFRGSYATDEFEPHVELWEIYLPRHNLVCILADQSVRESGPDGQARPLWVQKWVGPPTGPYLYLKFGVVPGAALAKAPMMDLYELHLNANNVHRKANNTIRRLKELTLYSRNQEHDAVAIKKAMDGEFVPVDNPDRIKTYVSAGAALNGLFAAANVYKELFSFVGGNLELLAGRSAQSRTATQDKILNQNAGAGIGAMHGEVEKLMAAAGENLLWYAHHHPELVMQSEYKLAGTKGVTRQLYPADSEMKPRRDWPFNRAKLRLDPYSIRHKSPDERLAFVQGVLGMLTPMLPLLSQQGVALDANALIDVFADLGDAPELRDLFTAAPPMGEAGSSGSHERTLASDTERTYTRNSNPQPKGADQQVAEMSPEDFGASQQGAA